jgi:adenine/guanine phosphoribosyltransferase-like PRPP-binding protein
MSALNLLVFRGNQRRVSGQELRSALAGRLELLCRRPSHGALLHALLLAGELECGMADRDSVAAHPIELLTDGIAEKLLRREPASHVSDVTDFHGLADAARAVPVHEQLNISTPEGFTYYALHPLAYADVLDRIPLSTNCLMVVGIRTIGTTLSAVMAAAARLRGMQVRRVTVRPQGHPYNRRSEFSPKQLAVIKDAVSSRATFAIVDEGPGLSGSSFLSVAEALERAGAPRESLILVGGHEPNVDALCAQDAALRWQRFRYVAVAGESPRPVQAVNFIGAGQWRDRLFGSESEWPASWTSFERLKYLASAERGGEPRLFKFAGLGHYGEQVLEREEKVAEGGFGPRPRQESDGFVSYRWIEAGIGGRPMSSADVSRDLLACMAEYCAFRLGAFRVAPSDLNALQQMAEHNLHELRFDLPVQLRLERPVIADGRMQPHEWLLTGDCRLLKTDSGSHGDDHFFPGPTDIAWDLAGAIVEWRLDEQQAKEFLDLYFRASRDDARDRIGGFIQAYAVFRCAYCMMAANAMQGSDEQSRLEHAAAGYKAVLMRMEARSLSAA